MNYLSLFKLHLPMDYILHLETSTKVCSVALSKNGQLLQLVETSEEGYVHGEKLTLFIQEILEKEGISPKAIKVVSVASGPGSYTGLRIGVSTAKGLCFALDIPLIAIDSLQCLYALSQKHYPFQTIIPMIDARRMEVFSSVFSSEGEVLKKITADILEETTYSEFEPFVAIGDGVEKLQEFWKDRNVIIDPSVIASAAGQVELAYIKYVAKDFEDVAYFEPYYLKDFVVGVSTKNALIPKQ